MKIKEKNLNEPRNPQSNIPAVSGLLLVSELENFYYEMGEDWHLWDEEEQGQYPIRRVFDAMKKFVDYHKSKTMTANGT
jgi:hypothetical protein